MKQLYKSHNSRVYATNPHHIVYVVSSLLALLALEAPWTAAIIEDKASLAHKALSSQIRQQPGVWPHTEHLLHTVHELLVRGP